MNTTVNTTTHDTVYSIPLFATAAERDHWCGEHAAQLEMIRGKFRGPVDRHVVADMFEATAHAESNRTRTPWRVYAVMPCGFSAHICNLR